MSAFPISNATPFLNDHYIALGFYAQEKLGDAESNRCLKALAAESNTWAVTNTIDFRARGKDYIDGWQKTRARRAMTLMEQYFETRQERISSDEEWTPITLNKVLRLASLNNDSFEYPAETYGKFTLVDLDSLR